jgi:hypothetical protein
MLKSQVKDVLTRLFGNRFGLLLGWVVVSLALYLSSGQARAVPAAPNESLVHGEIIEVEAIDSLTLDIRPKRTILRVKLRLIKVDAVEGRSNFLRPAEGKTIEVYTTEIATQFPTVGKTVKGRISFRGDERSGRYWIVGTLETVPQ